MNTCATCKYFSEDYAPIDQYSSGWHDMYCGHPSVAKVNYISGYVSSPDPITVRGKAETCDKWERQRGMWERIRDLFKAQEPS